MSSGNCILIDRDNVQQFIDSFDNILTDCDGVLWNDMDPISGSGEAIHLMKKMGKRVFYVTNNSAKTREEYAEKCAKLGFPADKEEIIGSAYVTAQYIKDVLKYTGKVYLIGGQGLKQELDNVGIPSFGAGKDETDFEHLSMTDVVNLPLDPEVGCVVVGYDHFFNYGKLHQALGYLSKRPDCHFVCSNPDNALPMGPDARPIPGTGSIVACVEIAANRKAIICGKPYRPIFDVVKQKHNVDPSRTIMIGDRCNTDIALAHNCGLRALLVLTGYNTVEDMNRLQASIDPADQLQVPHYYIPRLGDLVDLLNKAGK